MKPLLKSLICIGLERYFRLSFAFFALSFAFLSNLSAVCFVVNNAAVCDSIVNNDVYNDSSLDIPSRDYLNVTASGISIYNDHNGTWDIVKVNVRSTDGVYAYGSNINIGNNPYISINGSFTYGINANSNSNVNIGDDLNINTNGDYAFGVYAYDNSSVGIGDDLNINTNGDYAVGVHAYTNSNITIGNNSYISTNGNVADGVSAYGNANINTGNNLNISTNGSYAYGVDATDNSNISVGDNSYISTNGDSAFGVGAYTNSNITVGNNLNISTNGINSDGVLAYINSNINIGNNLSVNTNGISGEGVYAYMSNITAGDDLFINTNGTVAYGVYAQTNSNIHLGSNATIYSNGDNAYGVHALSLSTINIGNNSYISTNGSYAYGVFANSSNIDIADNLNIHTDGNYAYGVHAANSSNIDIGDNLNINTNGDFADGISAYSNSNITVGDNLNVNTNGDYAFGVWAEYYSNINIGNNSYITGVRAYTNSNITVGDNLNVNTNGTQADGISASSNSNITVGNNLNVNINGDGGFGIFAFFDSNIHLGSNATIHSNRTNAYAICAFDNSTVSNDYGSLSITGNLSAESAGAIINLTFADTSYLKGSTSLISDGIIDLTFDGSNSVWQLMGDSNLSNLNLLNNARVDLTRGGANLTSISPTVLTIDNLYGNGTFDVRFDLINESSDKIAIAESSSGEYRVNFYDKTIGAYTLTDNVSLLIIEQNNSSGSYAAAYTGKIDIGGYEHNLTKSALNDNWYIDFAAGTSTHGGSGGGGTPVCSSAHCAVKGFLNINYLTNFIDSQTLLQRTGEIREGRHDREDIWARVYFGQLDSFEADTRINKVKYYGIQSGADKANEYKYVTTYLGWALGYSKSEIDYLKGSGRSDNFYSGIYASALFDSSAYVDFAAKYNYNKDKFDTVTSNGYDVSGDGSIKGFSIDVEGGKRFDISRFYTEPQIGISYVNQNGGKIDSTDGMKITLGDYESYRVKAGLLLGYKIKDIVNIYLKGGYIKELNPDASYVLNGNLLDYKLNDNIIDSATGFMIDTDNYHIYFEGAYQIGSEFNNKKANIGYRYDF